MGKGGAPHGGGGASVSKFSSGGSSMNEGTLTSAALRDGEGVFEDGGLMELKKTEEYAEELLLEGMYIVERERWERDETVAFLWTVFDYVQTALFIIDPVFQWNMRLDGRIWRWIRRVHFHIPIAARGKDFWAGCFYAHFVLTVAALATTFWVAHRDKKLKKGHKPWELPARLVHGYFLLMVHGFGVSSLLLYAVAWDCSWGFGRLKHGYTLMFPGGPVSCTSNSGPFFLAFLAVPLWSALCFLVISCSPTLNPATPNVMAAADTRVATRRWNCRALMAVGSVIIKACRMVKVLALWHFFLVLVPFLDQMRHQPFHRAAMNYAQSALWASLMWGAAVLVVSFHISPANVDMAKATDALFFGLLPAAAAGALLAHRTFLDVRNRVCRPVAAAYTAASAASAEDPRGSATAVAQATDAEIFRSVNEVQLAHRLLLGVYRLRQRAPQQQRVLAEAVLLAGLRAFPESPTLNLSYCSFCTEILLDFDRIQSSLEKARSSGAALTWRDRYVILCHDRRLRELKQGQNDGQNMDMHQYMDFNNRFRDTITSHKQALKANRLVWRLLFNRDTNVRFRLLANAIANYENSKLNADKSYRALLERYPTNIALLRTFGHFLADVRLDAKAALALFAEANKLEDLAAEARGAAEAEAGGAGQAANVNDKKDIVCVIDQAGTMLVANKLLHAMFGFKRDELVNKNVSTLIPYPFTHQHAQYVKRLSSTGQGRVLKTTRMVEARHKRGFSFRVNITITQIESGGDVRYMAVFSQFDPPAEEKGKLICRLMVDDKGLVRAFNKSFIELLDFTEKDVLRKDLLSFFSPAARAQIGMALESIPEKFPFSDKKELSPGDCEVHLQSVPVLSKDGTSQSVHLVLQPAWVLAGTQTERQAVASSIAARFTLVDADSASTMTINGEGTIVAANKACCDLFGYSQEALKSMNVNKLMPPPYNILHNHHLKRFHELGTGPFIGSTRVLPVVHSNGSSFLVNMLANPVPLKPGETLGAEASQRLFVAQMTRVGPLHPDQSCWKLFIGADDTISRATATGPELFKLGEADVKGNPLSKVVKLTAPQGTLPAEAVAKMVEQIRAGDAAPPETGRVGGRDVSVEIALTHVGDLEVTFTPLELLEGIVSFDDGGAVVKANRAAELLFGREGGRMAGEAVTAFVPGGVPVSHAIEGDSYERILAPGLHRSGVALQLKIDVCRVVQGGQSVHMARVTTVDKAPGSSVGGSVDGRSSVVAGGRGSVVSAGGRGSVTGISGQQPVTEGFLGGGGGGGCPFLLAAPPQTHSLRSTAALGGGVGGGCIFARAVAGPVTEATLGSGPVAEATSTGPSTGGLAWSPSTTSAQNPFAAAAAVAGLREGSGSGASGLQRPSATVPPQWGSTAEAHADTSNYRPRLSDSLPAGSFGFSPGSGVGGGGAGGVAGSDVGSNRSGYAERDNIEAPLDNSGRSTPESDRGRREFPMMSRFLEDVAAAQSTAAAAQDAAAADADTGTGLPSPTGAGGGLGGDGAQRGGGGAGGNDEGALRGMMPAEPPPVDEDDKPEQTIGVDLGRMRRYRKLWKMLSNAETTATMSRLKLLSRLVTLSSCAGFVAAIIVLDALLRTHQENAARVVKFGEVLRHTMMLAVSARSIEALGGDNPVQLPGNATLADAVRRIESSLEQVSSKTLACLLGDPSEPERQYGRIVDDFLAPSHTLNVWVATGPTTGAYQQVSNVTLWRLISESTMNARIVANERDLTTVANSPYWKFLLDNVIDPGIPALTAAMNNLVEDEGTFLSFVINIQLVMVFMNAMVFVVALHYLRSALKATAELRVQTFMIFLTVPRTIITKLAARPTTVTTDGQSDHSDSDDDWQQTHGKEAEKGGGDADGKRQSDHGGVAPQRGNSSKSGPIMESVVGAGPVSEGWGALSGNADSKASAGDGTGNDKAGGISHGETTDDHGKAITRTSGPTGHSFRGAASAVVAKNRFASVARVIKMGAGIGLAAKSAASGPGPPGVKGAKSFAMQPPRRTLDVTGAESYVLLTPVVLFGVCSIVIFSVSYQLLLSALAGVEHIKFSAAVQLAAARVVFFAQELVTVSHEAPVATISALRDGLRAAADDIVLFQEGLLVGNSTLGLVGTVTASLDHDALIYGEGCLSQNQAYCYPESHPWFPLTQFGLDDLVHLFASRARDLSEQSVSQLSPSSNLFQFIWEIGGGLLPEALEKQSTLFKQDTSDVIETVKNVQIAVLVAIVCAGALFFARYFAPWIEHTLKEPQYVAHLLSDLPTELNLDNLFQNAKARYQELVAHKTGKGPGRR